MFTCDFEADLSIAIGVKDKNRTVNAYFAGSQYVIDINH